MSSYDCNNILRYKETIFWAKNWALTKLSKRQLAILASYLPLNKDIKSKRSVTVKIFFAKKHKIFAQNKICIKFALA